uniref:Amidase domain-containing protein n=1 Tax=Ascaris lumbricoides TaxID=6252 RepID=A0A0M3HQP7_ASCLU
MVDDVASLEAFYGVPLLPVGLVIRDVEEGNAPTAHHAATYWPYWRSASGAMLTDAARQMLRAGEKP